MSAWSPPWVWNLNNSMTMYKTFRVVEHGKPMHKGYKRIPYEMVFHVKFDGHLKSRLVAGGHLTDKLPKEGMFSSVVSMEAVRLGFIISHLNHLMVCAGDIGNAFLYVKCKEKVFVIGGPESGPELAGKRLIINKALYYGLQTSAPRFHENLSVSMH
jgi:hypothetical protein